MEPAALSQFRSLCKEIVAGRLDPYEAARELHGLGMSNVPREDGTADDDAWAHWLIWGALTDWIEVRPEETAQAEGTIIDAAKEWLAVEGDREAMLAYFDRMIYDVCGYSRPERPSDSN